MPRWPVRRRPFGFRDGLRGLLESLPSVQVVGEVHSGTLLVEYQPIVELASGKPAGFEALLRLPGADPPIPTTELIRTAEDTGLITMIGDWVLRQALADAVRLNPPGTSHGRYVSVNVSARQLRQPDFVEAVRTHLAETRADPSLIVLEITENLLVDGADRAWEFLADLRRDGIRIAIDDFGTGHASLSYLRQPGIDIVKIDQSFLADTGTRRGRILLKAIADLCSELGLHQIAEGIESTTARDAALTVGCRHGQGYLYAPALPIADAINWPRT